MTVKNTYEFSGSYSYSGGLSRTLQITVTLLIILVFVLALLDLTGWLFHISFLKSIGPEWVPMQIPTSICFILASTALAAIRIALPATFRKILTRVPAILIILASLTTLYAYFYLIGRGHESSLSEISFLTYFTAPEYRMAFLTAFNFLLIGCILILLSSGQKRATNIAHILIIPVAIISYFVLVSYIFGVNSATRLHGLPVALNSGIAFCGLCAAVLLIKPDSWLLEVFVNSETGGIFARKLLPALMLLPLIIGWFRIKGEKAGLYHSDEGVLLVAVTYTVSYLSLIWIISRSVNRIDRKRRISEEALKKSYDRLEILSEISSRLLVSSNPQILVNELCSKVMHFLGCQVFFNFLIDETTGKLHLNAYSGISLEKAQNIEWLDFGTAVCGCVARDGKRLIAENIQETDDIRTELIKPLGIKAYVCHPLLSADKVIGTLSFGTTQRVIFSDDDLSMMKTVADQVAIAMFRIENEKKLRESEDRFRTIAESIPVHISISRISDSTFRFTNEIYDTTLGFQKGELIGKKVQDLYYDPADRQKVIDILKKEGQINNFELRVKTANGSPLWIMTSIRTIKFGGEPSYLNAFIDITESKKAQEELLRLNRTLDALSKSSHAMMHSDNELLYLNEVCKIIIEDCGHAMVWIGYAQNDNKKSVKPVAFHGFDKGYIEHMDITWDDTERGRGPTGTAIRTGKPSLCEDMKTDPAFKPWREEALKRGYASSLVLPLMSEGKPFGALSIYSKEKAAFSDSEINLLSALANDLAYGVSYLRLTQSERAAANAIKESEERYKLITTNTPDHILVQDADLRYSYVLNPQLGIKEEELLGKTDYEILSEADADLLTSIKKKVLRTGKPEYVNLPILDSNGEYQYFEGSYVPKYNKLDQIDGIIGYFRNVTGRKKMEEALRESETNLWSVLNATKESVYMFDREGKFTLANATGLKRMNKTYEKELIGHNFSEFMTAELARDRQSKLDEVFMSGEPLEFEDERAGFVFHHNFYPVFKDNEVSKVATYSTDITERKLAEKELQRTKNHLESLINYASAPIIVWNPDNEIQLFNHAFERLTGYSSEEVIGKKLNILFPDISPEESDEKMKISLTENMQTIEIPVLTKRNEIRTVLWNSANIYDDDNRTVLSTIAQGNDITERVRAETEVNKSKEKLDIALDSGNIGIWEWNLKEDKFEWDKRMGKMFGPGQDLSNKTYNDFEKYIYEDDVLHFRNAIHRTLEEDIPFELIYRIKHHDGEISYISTKASIEKNKEGIPVKMTGVCFDITEMKKGTEQALFKLNEDLQRSNKELEQFAYVASHDLQEPLRMVSSFTQLLSMRYKDKLDKEAHEFIKFAVDGAFRMQNLINDLLEYSRIGTRGKNLSVVDMNSILGQAIYNLNIKIAEKGALVTNDELPSVFADGGQMVQLLQNLIGNALKFCIIPPRIHISAKEEKNQYLFAVKDNGIGIEPEYCERIFQIFQRLHPKDEYSGTGIGLAICRRIVERHEGKIWVESKAGEGSVFKFTLKKK